MSNPLLQTSALPAFDAIETEHIQPAVSQLIDSNRTDIEQLLEQQPSPPTWTSLIIPLAEIEDRLDQAWSPISHLNAVVNSDNLRDTYNQCLPILSEYGTELGQNQKLYQAYQQLADNPTFADLSQAQRQSIQHALRDFTLSGISLEGEAKERYKELKKRLSELTNQFAENVLDATQGWQKHLPDASQLGGLPDTALASARSAAEAKGLQGYLFSLDIPSYLPVMTYADDRSLRREMYEAYVTRASDQGPTAGQWDNSSLMHEIVQLRQEMANLVGFSHYADYSLATKMAENSEQVIDFLRDLAAKSHPVAKQEFAELSQFSTEQFQQAELQAWDVPYFSEKLRQHRYAISQEELRPYFPADQVLQGLFDISSKLFGIDIKADQFTTWHDDVRCYNILRDGQIIASFYFDLFARENKRGGAWMADCRVRRQTAQGMQKPVAFLTCNFTAPVDNKPSLLTHNEVTTLFHEFGHGLHHMLTQVDVAAVSGINGVAWDAVELPSQFLENWCWQPESLALFAKHHETGAALPVELLNRMLAAKNFQSGMFMSRQLEFALFDFLLHMEYSGPDYNIQDLLNQVRQEVSVTPLAEFNRFQHSFGHIFAGGYAAGYYSYKWAEVLSADAFSRFEEEGIFNTQCGHDFLTSILERGGSQPPMELFVEFRGRKPSVEALLRHSGIVSSNQN